jgi:hypothetical protein
MRSTEDSEAARRLNAARWSPEARLRAAVDTVVKRRADLDDSQRAQLREIAGPEDTDD